MQQYIFGDLFALLLLVLMAGVLAYPFRTLHRTMVGYFSLLQILYLVLVPGFVVVILVNYIGDVLLRPVVDTAIFSDTFLVTAITLSLMVTYGGIAIHSVTKMLSDTSLREAHSDAAMMNRHFHLVFSHNLIYSGAIVAFLSLTLLELHHLPSVDRLSTLGALLRGGLLGLLTLGSMYFYVRSDDQYGGRWWDLKTSFLLVWLATSILIYAIFRMTPSLRSYDLLLPVLLGYFVLAFFNLVLVFRRFRRGRVPEVEVDLSRLWEHEVE